MLEKPQTQRDESLEILLELKKRYKELRGSDYPLREEYLNAWNHAFTEKEGIQILSQGNWLGRGKFPNSENGESTIRRASLNVEIDREIIDELDQLIIDGKLIGYYKFGNPESKASAIKRHDSITIYFTEEPSQEVIEKIKEITESKNRGDNLLGQKISDGFYVSEFGAFQSHHIEELIEQINFTKPELTEALKMFLSDLQGNLNMSEGQYYVLKDFLKEYGYDMRYDNEKGFYL